MTLKHQMRLQRIRDNAGTALMGLLLVAFIVAMAVAVLSPHRAPY